MVKKDIKVLLASTLTLGAIFLMSFSILDYNVRSLNLSASAALSKSAETSVVELNKEIEDIVSRNESLARVETTLTTLLENRKNLLLKHLEKDPTKIYELGLSSRTLSKLNASKYTTLEKLIPNISGNLEVVYYDDFDNSEKSFVEYYLVTREGVKYNFFPFNENTLIPNKKIEIRNGIQLGETIFGEASRLLVNIEAIPDIIAYNTGTTIRWQAQNATSCTGSGGSNGWAGQKDINGGTFSTGKLTTNKTYTITCQNNFDSNTSSATVKVVSSVSTYINNDMNTYTPPVSEPAPYKVGVLLVNPSPNWPIPFSVDEVKKEVFDGQFQKFLKESSYGKRYITGDVYGWIQLDQQNPDCTPYDGGQIHMKTPGVEQYIVENNIPLENYNYFLIITHCTNNNGIAFGTAFEINGTMYTSPHAVINIKSDGLTEQWLGQPLGISQPFSWTRFDRLLSHEFGHILGLWEHAEGWDCGSESSGDNCTIREYGNPFDTMGEGGYATQYNGFYKRALGWLTQNQALNITQSGRYTINTLETVGGIKHALITNPVNPSPVKYSVEYRKAIGFDGMLNNPVLSSNQNGLIINRIQKSLSAPLGGLLIDATPSTENWFLDIQDAALREPLAGEGVPTFADTINGISITNVKKGINNISFDVQLDLNIPHCIHYPVNINAPSTPYIFSLSAPSHQFIPFTNPDDVNLCGGSTLFINILPVNSVIEQSVLMVDLPAGDTRYVSVGTSAEALLKIKPGTIPGTYTYNMQVYNTNNAHVPEANVPFTVVVIL